MEIDCDRANPDVDQFTITVLDERGRTTRRERYTRAEIEESSRMLRGMPNLSPVNIQGQITVTIQPATQPSTQPAMQTSAKPATAPSLTPEETALLLEAERRQAAAAAATQPARVRR